MDKELIDRVLSHLHRRFQVIFRFHDIIPEEASYAPSFKGDFRVQVEAIQGQWGLPPHQPFLLSYSVRGHESLSVYTGAGWEKVA